jgi:hypothetical protein
MRFFMAYSSVDSVQYGTIIRIFPPTGKKFLDRDNTAKQSSTAAGLVKSFFGAAESAEDHLQMPLVDFSRSGDHVLGFIHGLLDSTPPLPVYTINGTFFKNWSHFYPATP